jgi:ECF sigma factor
MGEGDVGLEVDEAVPEDVTGLLRAWSDGDADALAALTPLVYRELHRRAHWHMAREADGHVLQTTALVNEIYPHGRLRNVSWRDRAHFFALSSRLIRRDAHRIVPTVVPSSFAKSVVVLLQTH